MWFIFNLQREKYVQYKFIEDNIHKWFLSAKIPYLGWWPSVQGVKLTPLWSHIENQLPHFPQVIDLNPSPKPTPFSALEIHTCDTVLRMDDNISTKEVFFVRNTPLLM
jgi:hypothetical protein